MVTLAQLERWIAPLKRRVQGMIARGFVTSVTDNKHIQLLQVSIDGQVHDGVEHPQPYGFTSRPLSGAQALITFVGGNREAPIAVIVDDGRHRVQLADGEVAIYSSAGSVIKLGADGKISLGDGSALLPTAGVLTGECIDSFTGAPYADKSAVVKAKKV